MKPDDRDDLRPQRPGGMGRGALLALLVHGGLLVALAIGVSWRVHEPSSVSAELWSAVPQQAAPRAQEPPPAAPQPKPEPKPEPKPAPPPEPKPAPPPEPKPQQQQQQQQQEREAEIALEKARLEKEAREKEAQEKALREKEAREREAREKEVRERQAREQQERERRERERRLAEERKAEQQRRAEEERKQKLAEERAAKQREEALARQREEQLKRIQGLAGATGAPNSTGTAMQSAGPSASYTGRIIARIKPNIVFTEDPPGNPVAVVEVRAAPDGTIVGRRLIKPSGHKAWDDAVLRAVDRTEVLPRDVDGRVPPTIIIDFRPRD